MLHTEKSADFKDYFRNFSFEERISRLDNKEGLFLFAAVKDNNYAGYCILTIDNGIGEIDSLFVKNEFRGGKTGAGLMKKAVEKLYSLKIKNINISVAAGNESVIGFYEKFGFKKKFEVLQKVEN